MRRRGRGFTLVELMVAMAVGLIIAALVLPQFSHLRDSEMCNQAAQAIAADCRRMSAQALQGETYTVVYFSSATQYSLYSIPHNNTGGYTFTQSSWTLIFTRNLNLSYGASTINLSSFPAYIAFGPRGWPSTSSDPNYVSGAPVCTLGGAWSTTSDPSTGQTPATVYGSYYAVPVISGTSSGISDTARIFVSGSAVVTTP